MTPETTKFPISYLTMMLFSCNSLLDTGKFDDITLEDVKRHTRAGDLIPYLSACAKAKGEDFDGEFFSASTEFTAWFMEKIQDICEALDHREGRKFGVDSRGLCLLMAYTAEVIQRGDQIRLAAIA